MCSKSAHEPAPDPRRIGGDRPWGLSIRLAAGFAVAAFALLLITSGLLYWALASNLDQEDAEYLGEKIAIVDGILRTRPRDVAELNEEVSRESQQRFYPPVLIRVLDRRGTVVAQTSGMSSTLPADVFPKPVAFPGGAWSAESHVAAAGKPFGITAVTIHENAPDGGEVVQIGLDESQEQALLARYRRWLWLAMGGGLIVSGLVGYGIAARGLRPIRRMAEAVRAIGSENLGQRVAPAGFPPELASLAQTFNGMLQRLDESFTRLSRFSADIAHELRTPINNVRGLVEVSLERARAGQGVEELLGPCLDECQRLSRLIDNLLFLARAENPRSQIQRQELVLLRELETVAEFYEAAASESGVAVEVDAPAHLTADADRLLFQRALGNLVENALAHTPAGGTVRLSAARQNGRVQVSVSDTGRGIPPEHLGRVFERFHRVDASRSKHTGGVGLGLAIVRSIALLHGGDVQVASTVGAGTCFTLSLPAAAGAGEGAAKSVTPVSQPCHG